MERICTGKRERRIELIRRKKTELEMRGMFGEIA
jgi:hypothetical protein